MPPPRIAGNVYRRKDCPVFWLWYWDRAGAKQRQATHATDEAAARQELAGVLDRVRRGEDTGPGANALTVASWGRRWVELRRAAGKGEADNEAAHLEHHIIPVLGRVALKDLSTSQVLDFVRQLPARKAATGTGELLGAATVHKIAGTLRLALREAAKREVIKVSPCIWDASDLPERGSPAVGEGFSEAEVERLIFDVRVPEERRVLYALEFLTGMRTGEAAARRWKDWDQSKEPLTALRVETSWSTRRQVEKETKTRVRRTIPVHPTLAAVLEVWRAEGWARVFGATPKPEDLIVPGPGGAPRANNVSWRFFQEDLRLLELGRQRHYETRSTFLSLCEAGGADLVTVRLLTHPSPRVAADLYRRLRLLWPRMCAAVQVIQVPPPAARAA